MTWNYIFLFWSLCSHQGESLTLKVMCLNHSSSTRLSFLKKKQKAKNFPDNLSSQNVATFFSDFVVFVFGEFPFVSSEIIFYLHSAMKTKN